MERTIKTHHTPGAKRAAALSSRRIHLRREKGEREGLRHGGKREATPAWSRVRWQGSLTKAGAPRALRRAPLRAVVRASVVRHLGAPIVHNADASGRLSLGRRRGRRRVEGVLLGQSRDLLLHGRVLLLQRLQVRLLVRHLVSRDASRAALSSGAKVRRVTRSGRSAPIATGRAATAGCAFRFALRAACSTRVPPPSRGRGALAWV